MAEATTTSTLLDIDLEEIGDNQNIGSFHSSNSSSSRRSSDSTENYNLILDDHIHFNGFFFENCSQKQQQQQPRSPKLRRPINVNLREYCENLSAAGRGIYSIDEISEVSGRSEMLLINERAHMEKVNKILAVQQAHRLQRLAKQCCNSSDTKLLR